MQAVAQISAGWRRGRGLWLLVLWLLVLWSAVCVGAGGWAAEPESVAAARQAPECGSEGRMRVVGPEGRAVPIVLFPGAPVYNREAAEDLARVIERMSGRRPEIIYGVPEPVPERAIWIGVQPAVRELFPGLDLSFREHEEILIAAGEKHLLIAGRDLWDPEHVIVDNPRGRVLGRQQEYGSVNAVYTFMQDCLGVRWLWPGELGEVVEARPVIAFEPFVYRYHPQIRGRSGLLHFSNLSTRGYGRSRDWTRRQRLQLDSLDLAGGHAFTDWFERFHETHPEYFALQPDGTRSGYPGGKDAKLCLSNPAVWDQWLADVEADLERDPGLRVFNSASNDSWLSGHCVCETCEAWDHPDGELRHFIWAGVHRRHVALSDRHLTFANTLAKRLRERYPDRDYAVLMLSYGHSRPPPIATVPAANVIVSNVANFFLRDGLAERGSPTGITYREQYDSWSRVAPRLVWRPNTGSPVGWQQGLPDVPISQTIADFRYVTERGCVGVFIDSVWEHWATQGPLYYVMAQLTWDPRADGQAILADYYARGFGPAAEPVAAYWQHLEASRQKQAARRAGDPHAYDVAFFATAYGHLDAAADTLTDAPAVYRQRLAFVRAGLDWTRLVLEVQAAMAIMKRSGKRDPELTARVLANWAAMQQLCSDHPGAINWWPVEPSSDRMTGLHPDFTPLTPPIGDAPLPVAQSHASRRVFLRSAAEAGWAPASRSRPVDTAHGHSPRRLCGRSARESGTTPRQSAARVQDQRWIRTACPDRDW